ncbi:MULTISPECIES: fluoride efflux transporter CrcB [Bacillus]|uniref:Fluoride-specific ion channel FluC n=2 Tax=Bacillus TaxID=1386 RepID=A0A0M4FV99_9BACI|nr:MULTISPECIES: fluoride efflux transporter CrcB [Bacillus]ALC80575.1 camphor resistance protein CrcB [Bacillus gobiensis]MBP1083664.1 CrcB protein [Bacillus capparidis]MED1094856.1 fluoride efflux transporter CrcB [Bacillus capparidis]
MMILAVMAAGGLGSALRFWLGQLISSKKYYTQIPIAILLINVLGSFGLGIFTYLQMTHPALITIISTGFFGAFTTFSTFSVEAIQLFMDHKVKEAFVYILLSVFGCLLAYAAGFSIYLILPLSGA